MHYGSFLSVAASISVLAGGILSGTQAWATCYVVYDAKKQVVYRSQTPPVDMSRTLSETVPKLAPGARLVFSLDNDACQMELDKLPGRVAFNSTTHSRQTKPLPAQQGQDQ